MTTETPPITNYSVHRILHKEQHGEIVHTDAELRAIEHYHTVDNLSPIMVEYLLDGEVLRHTVQISNIAGIVESLHRDDEGIVISIRSLPGTYNGARLWDDLTAPKETKPSMQVVLAKHPTKDIKIISHIAFIEG
jgi:hypothetical protein